MLIRFCQFFALVVLVVPVLSIVPKLSSSATGWNEILVIFLLSCAFNLTNLAARLEWRTYRLLPWLQHALSLALLVLLLWRPMPVAASALLPVYVALLHAFAFHGLVYGSYPLRSGRWETRQIWNRRLVIATAALRFFLLPLYLFWVWHYLLVPGAQETQHISELLLGIGAPMTIVAVILGIVYLGIEALVKIDRQSSS